MNIRCLQGLFVIFLSLLALSIQLSLVSNVYSYSGTEKHTYIHKKADVYPKIINIEDKRYQKLDINKLPNNQLIKVEGKVLSVDQAKQKIKHNEAKMAEAEKKQIALAKSRSKQIADNFNLQNTARRKSLIKSAIQVAQPLARSALQAQLAPGSQKYTKIYQKSKQYYAYKPQVTKPQTSYPRDKTTPVISRINVNSGQPGDPIVIDGRDFGDPNPMSAVRFYTASGKKATLLIEYWSQTQIVGILPSIPVTQSYKGLIWITKPNGKQSKKLGFRYDPEMEIKTLNISRQNYSSGGGFCRTGGMSILQGGSLVRVSKCSKLFGSSADDQLFFRNERLKNNWKVESVHFQKVVSEQGEADAKVTQKYVGTNRPYVKVHFWVTAFDRVTYWLSIQIKGPKGMPHF